MIFGFLDVSMTPRDHYSWLWKHQITQMNSRKTWHRFQTYEFWQPQNLQNRIFFSKHGWGNPEDPSNTFTKTLNRRLGGESNRGFVSCVRACARLGCLVRPRPEIGTPSHPLFLFVAGGHPLSIGRSIGSPTESNWHRSEIKWNEVTPRETVQ